MECHAEFLSAGSFDWVGVKGGREHVIEVGNGRQWSVAHNDQSIGRERVQENDWHDLETQGNTVLNEPNHETICQASELSVIFARIFKLITFESTSLEILRMIDRVLHDFHTVLDLLGKDVVHVEAGDQFWDQEKETIAVEFNWFRELHNEKAHCNDLNHDANEHALENSGGLDSVEVNSFEVFSWIVFFPIVHGNWIKERDEC